MSRSRTPLQGGAPNLPNKEGAIGDFKVFSIPIGLIDPSPFQLRSRLDPERLRSLSESLRREGQLRPVRVRPRGERYELVYGHRTLEAARMLGWESVEAVVSDATDEEVVLAQRAENREREDWSDYDLACWYRMMIERFGYKQEDLAKIDGVSQSRVAQYLRMLKLEKFITTVILAQITEWQARTILSVPEELLPELCQRVEEYYQHNTKPLTMDDINIMTASVRLHHVFRAIAEERQRRNEEGPPPPETVGKTEEKAPFPETGESVGESITAVILSPTETPLSPKGAEKEVFEEPAGAPVYESVNEPKEIKPKEMAGWGVRPPKPETTTCPLCGQKMHRQTLETRLEELIRAKATLEALLSELRGGMSDPSARGRWDEGGKN
ncbi:MAG: ParB/RepB/Spo0J family partition protein [Candidatus Bathyarchaeia archaeon]